MRTLLRSVLLANGKIADILIENGRIAAVDRRAHKADRTVDCAGLTALPGLVDMHAHFREPGFEKKEDIATGSAAAVRGGYCAVCCMPNTNPPVDNVPLVRYIRERAKEVGLCAVYPIACITKGAQSKELSDMRKLHDAGAIAFSDDGKPVSDPLLMRYALEYAKDADLLLISHSEDLRLTDGGSCNEGANATHAGLKAITRASEEIGIAREIILAATLGARVHIAHVSTRGSVEIVRQAKAHGVRVTAETCPHYFACDDSEILSYNTAAKINPPLRTPDDVAAIVEGLRDGTIDAIATDHAPHTHDDKDLPFEQAAFGTIGLETAFAVGYTHLVKPGHLTLARLSELMSAAPARILGLPNGTLDVGARADVTLVDTRAEFVYDAASGASKSHNSVFDGKRLCGAVVGTIVGGEFKFEA